MKKITIFLLALLMLALLAAPALAYDHLQDDALLFSATEAAQLEQALLVLRDQGEDACFAHIRTQLLGKRR